MGEDGKPLGRVARVQREPIATCPRCDGQIRENSRAYGCSSWKSKKNPGCGFVIWKSMKGHEITPDEAKTVIEKGKIGPLEFRDRAGEFRAPRADRREGGRGRAERLRRSRGVADRPDPLSWASMDAIVTGGAGFIGSHVTDALLARGGQVAWSTTWPRQRERVPAAAEFAEVDIRDGAALGRWSTRCGRQAVFHLAAQADVRVSVEDPGLDADVNVRGTIEVLERRPRRDARVVFSSTGGALYGEADTVPSPESTPAAPMAPYGISKFCAEQYLEPVQPAVRHAPRDAPLRQRLRPAPGPARRGRRGRDLLRQAGGGRDAADLRRRPADARLRATSATWSPPTWRRRLRRPAAGLQHRHPDRDQRGRPAGRPARRRPAPTSSPSTGRRGWASSSAAAWTARGRAASWAGGRR